MDRYLGGGERIPEERYSPAPLSGNAGYVQGSRDRHNLCLCKLEGLGSPPVLRQDGLDTGGYDQSGAKDLIKEFIYGLIVFSVKPNCISNVLVGGFHVWAGCPEP